VNNTSWLQQWLEKIWYGRNDQYSKARFLLLPLTTLYCAVNNFQRRIQTRDLSQIPCPVIVVGNITVGGTGKTPLTIHLVKLLQKAGYKPAIITRGYGGKAESWPQSVNENSDPYLVGDEAVLMAIRTRVPVYAGADRLLSIRELLKVHDCDVIISDDGMQHYRLPRDMQIAVIDGTRMLGNGYCLPAGPLREKKERLDDCDLVVVNEPVNIYDKKQWHTMSIEGKVLLNLLTGEKLSLADFSKTKVHAVTGIGNPERFYKSLELAGLQLQKHSFPDHHDFQQSDLLFDEDLPIVMTEKDAVKCRGFASSNCWYLPVAANLDTNFDQRVISHLERIKNG